jgi:hypothetical protein
MHYRCRFRTLEQTQNSHIELLYNVRVKWNKQRTVINLVSPIGTTNQDTVICQHVPLNISEMGSGD